MNADRRRLYIGAFILIAALVICVFVAWGGDTGDMGDLSGLAELLLPGTPSGGHHA